MTVRDLLYGLSLANVIMLRAWFIAGGSAYFNAHLPLHLAYVGLSLDFGLLGLVLAGLFAWSRRSVTGRRVAATILALLLLVPFDWVLRHGTGVVISDLSARWGWPVVAALLATFAGAVLAVRWLQTVVLRLLPIVTMPLVLVTLPYALTPLVTTTPAGPAAQSVPAAATGHRVLLLLFDALSERFFLQGERVPELPAFSRLRSEAFIATAATSTSDRTLTAVPSMLAGREVTLATPSGYDLNLTFADGSTGAWSREETVFDDVRQAGYWTGMVGWYHPYCDALPDRFDECVWMPMDPIPNAVFASMARFAHEAVAALSLLVREGLENALQTDAQLDARRRQHADALSVIDARGRAMARRMRPGLAMIHYPVPHTPDIRDLVAPARESQWTGHYANALVADEVLASLRSALEDEGAWEDMTVVIISDHGSRTEALNDDKVPFIIKLPAATAPFVYGTPTSLLVLRDLLPKLVVGEIETPQQLAQYLDAF